MLQVFRNYRLDISGQIANYLHYVTLWENLSLGFSHLFVSYGPGCFNHENHGEVIQGKVDTAP